MRLSLVRFGRWIGASTQGPFFFPEYSDHGPDHINRVLSAAAALVTPEAWRLLTAEDAAVLTLAALLHDAAMHLSADGLLALLDGPTAPSGGPPAFPVKGSSDHGPPARPLVDELDAKSWPQLFDDYLFEARRWDGRTLHRILGDRAKAPEAEGDLADVPRHVRECPNPETWTLQYRKFLGEFVRCHHARLAHEIARWGVPAPGPQPPAAPHPLVLALPSSLAAYADMAGLVARSHNLPLRGTFPYLDKKFYGRVSCKSAHPVFLMVLLRIADYLEIDASRASTTQLEVRRLRSPISQEEWDAHLAVEEIRVDEHDEEAVFVVAKPASATQFFKLRRLLSGLQQELDLSWAVLGEVFSRQGELTALDLRLRRVRSNLDDPADYLRDERPPYFPVEAGFTTAGAPLLQLLIRPLYGDRPEIGVRELLQNALDAVYELRSHLARRGDPELKTVSLANQDADVLIAIDDDAQGKHWLTITDKGIGMTADIIVSYFLKAGASFRRSDAWRREFESAGQPRILRSGRFGVGAFAAYLIGSRIELHTRHVAAAEQDAVFLSAALADEQLELARRPKASIGTTIRIEMPHRLDHQEPWDWYTLSEPRVERRLDGARLHQRFYVPDRQTGPVQEDWRRIHSEGFEAIDWTFSPAPALSCNGLLVTESPDSGIEHRRPGIVWKDLHIPWPMPSVSVFDPEGRLPLTLQRNALEGSHYPFSADLLRDVTLELIAFMLVHLPEAPWLLSGRDFIASLIIPEIALAVHSWTFLFTPSGFLLLHPHLLRVSRIQHALLVALHPEAGFRDLRSLPVEATIRANPERYRREAWRLEGGDLVKRLQGVFFGALAGIRMLTFGDRSGDAVGLRTLAHDGYRALREWGKVAGDLALMTDLRGQLSESSSVEGGFLAELFMAPEALPIVSSPFSEIWDDLMGGDPVIPFDRNERERKFAAAMNKLADRIAAWRRTVLPGWRGALVEGTASLDSAL